MSIYKRTEAHIRAGSLRQSTTSIWECGCEHRITRGVECRRWFVCQFHQGFDAGVETFMSNAVA